MSDIARLAGVSPSAVSFALNGRPGVSEETRSRILEIAGEVGWFPSAAARALTGSPTNIIGLVLTRSPRQISVHPFQLSFIAGLDAELSSRGYSLLLHIATAEDSELARYHRWNSERRVDGVVLLDLRVNDRRLGELKKMGLATLVVGDPQYAQGERAIWVDDATAVKNTVARLVDLGHRRIARVSESPSIAHAAIRNAAFLDACVMHGIAAPQIVHLLDHHGADAVTEELLSQPSPPSAILYESDVDAITGLKTARRMGVSVPHDLSIVAYDDSLLCEVSDPPLSAVSHDVYALGSDVASALISVISGDEIPGPAGGSVPELIERGSTGVAKSGNGGLEHLEAP